MGRIFSWEAVKKQRIPQLESFREIADMTRADLFSNKKVVAALLCGSILQDPSVRSDIDCVVIYNDIGVIPDLQGLIAAAKKSFVPLEMIPVDIRMVEMGVHTLTGNFFEHLQRAVKEGGQIKGDILSILKVSENGSKEKLNENIAIISQKLNRALCELSRFKDEKRIFNLGKILEAPVRITRDIVWTMGIPTTNESKKEILRAYWTIADPKSKELLTKITEVDSNYSKILAKVSSTLDKEPLKEEYLENLEAIEQLGKNEALEFIVHNAQMLNAQPPKLKATPPLFSTYFLKIETKKTAIESRLFDCYVFVFSTSS